MPRLRDPRLLWPVCLVAWLLVAPAAWPVLRLNLAHLAVRPWDPLGGTAVPGLPAAPPCVDPPDAAPGPCARAGALLALAGGEPDGTAAAIRLLDRPGLVRPRDGYLLGLADERAGRHVAALQAWGAAGALDRVLARGDGLLARGDAAGAEAEFTTVLSVLPDLGRAYLERGRARAAQGARWPAALADFRQAVAHGAGPEAQTELGAALWYAQGDLPGAQAALQAGWAGLPTAWAGTRWAAVLLDAGQPGAALAAADLALRRFPRDADLLAVRARALAAGGPAGAPGNGAQP